MNIDIKPAGIYLEITDACNMSCSMCMTKEHWRGKASERLTQQDIKNTILKPGRDIGLSHFTIRGCLYGEILGNINNMSIQEYLDSEKYHDFLEFVQLCTLCTHGCS